MKELNLKKNAVISASQINGGEKNVVVKMAFSSKTTV